jgi:hypothetical protein
MGRYHAKPDEDLADGSPQSGYAEANYPGAQSSAGPSGTIRVGFSAGWVV